jgi:copper transport protein
MKLRALAAAAGVIAFAFPAGAQAHALLRGASPPDGSRLSSSPRQVHLSFDEKISARFRSVRLVDGKGRTVPGVRAVGGAASSQLDIDLPKVGNGTYALVWRVLSQYDGHVTNGTLAFGVGPGGAVAAGLGVAEPTPAAADVVLRWLRFSFGALLLGGLAFVTFVLAVPRRAVDALVAARAARRVLTAAVVAGVAAGGVEMLILDRQTASLSSIGSRRYATTLFDLMFSSRWGALWLVHAGVLAVLVLLALRLRGRVSGVPARASAAIVLAGLTYVSAEALGSHAAALRGTSFAVAADAMHVLSASVWLGAVGALAVAVWPTRGLSRLDGIALAVALRRPFAFLAGGSVLVASVTGLYAAGVQVASVDALLTTLYGRAVLVKTALVLVAGLFGLTNAVLLGSLARGGLRASVLLPRVLVAELTGGAAILLAAGVLTSAAPARGPAFAQPRPIHSAALAGQASDLVVSMDVRPNRAGENVFTVLAASSRRPAPAPIARVALHLRNVGKVWLRQVAPGRYVGIATLDRAGRTAATVVIQRSREALATRFTWPVESPDPALPVTVSRLSLSSLTNPAAVMLVLAAAAALACAAAMRSGRRLPPARRAAVARVHRRQS